MAERMMATMNHAGRFPDVVSTVFHHPTYPDTGHGRLGMGQFTSPLHIQQPLQLRYEGPMGGHLHFGGAQGVPAAHGKRQLIGSANTNTGYMNNNGMHSGIGVRYTSQFDSHSSSDAAVASQGQLAASRQLQKLSTQHYSNHAHPASHNNYMNELQSVNHQVTGAQMEWFGDGDSAANFGAPSLAETGRLSATVLPSSGIDTDLIDEEVLMALVVEFGLDRIKELPELWLGQNEFDFVTDFVCKQQTRVS
ncbi:cbp/p300-interacting transactivator 2 [Polymixia lowei]